MQGLITYCESFIRLPNKYTVGSIALVGGKLFKYLGNSWIGFVAVNGTTVVDQKTKTVYKVINKKLVIDNSTKSKEPNFNALNNAPPFLYPTGGGGSCNPCDEIQALNTKVTIIEGQVSNLNTQVGSLNTQVSTINTQISTINTQLGTLGTQVSDLSVQYNGLLACSYINDAFMQSLLSWKQSGLDIDGEEPFNRSGHSVSVNSTGDIVAIGAIGAGTPLIPSFGHCKVYKFDGSGWVQLGQNIVGEATFDFSGNSVSLNSIGNIVAIGANFNDGINGVNSGHCRVYSLVGSTWIQLGLDIDGAVSGDQSGYSVSLNSIGDIVAIGAIFNDGNGSNSGHCKVYKFNGTAWNQLGGDIDDKEANDKSGYSVSLNSAGDTVAIGANNNDTNGANSGHCRVYNLVGSVWTKLGLDIVGEAAGDNSGFSVSLNSYGDIVAIGAVFNDSNGSNSGHCRVYKFDGSVWTKLGLDIDGEAANDKLGHSVSLNSIGNIVAIGATGNDANGSASGHCRIYKFNCYTDKWEKIGLDINGETSFDQSGWYISLNSNGNIVAIGAPFNDANGTSSGHCRIYKLSI